MISIIISIYNVEEYVRECINTIFQQTYKNWECILVDDGSKDNSGSICDEYGLKDERINVIHQINKGLSGARNTGLFAAQGEYVYFIDGDDKISTEALMNFVKYIGEKPDIVLGHMHSFREGERAQPYGKIVKDNEIRFASGKEAFSIIYNNNKELFMGVRGLYRKQFLIQNNIIFNENCRYSEDQEWTPRCFYLAQKIRSNESRDYYYRIGRTGSLMNTIDCRKIKLLLSIYDSWYKKIIENQNEEFYLCLYKMMTARMWSFFYQYPPVLSPNDYKEFCTMMDRRKYFINKKPKKIEMSVKMVIMKFFKTNTICILAKMWLKLNRENR